MLTNTHTYMTALLQNTLQGLRVRLRDESGQTAAEYMGVIVVIAALLAAVAATDLGETLTGFIGDAIEKVFENQD
jgi:Flp pilus assembly pilin Flp